MIQSVAGTIAELSQRAVDAARHLPGGRAYAVLARPVDLPSDPLAHHANEPLGSRRLLWWQQAWMVASGSAESITADGPGRTLHLAEAAARIRARTVMASCASSAPPAPVLQVALAFEQRSPGPSHWGAHLPGAQLVLPQRLWWRRRSGEGWRIDAVCVHAESKRDEIAAAFDAPVDQGPLAPAQPWSGLSQRSFVDSVADTAALIDNGAFRKVVLARAADHQANQPIDVNQVLDRLHRTADAWTYIYSCDLDDGSQFIGATPEILFHVKDSTLHTVALAGSRPRSDDTMLDQQLGQELLASTKERKEHQLVVEHLARQLGPRCSELNVPGTPSLRKLDRLQHLETPISGTLHQADPFDLMNAIHPTPAVAGLPVDAATDYLQRIEGLHRGLYTGTIGYVSANAARMLVPLRGGIIRDQQARLFAGAGIVETSDPNAEFMETELKLGPMRHALDIK